MEKLQNDHLTIAMSNHGAELQSITDKSGKEYLWQADERYWPRHSPILFPIVCGLWKGKFRTEGNEYPMGRHGFARDTDFKLIKHTATKATYALESSEETLKRYPYKFILSVSYILDGNCIHVIWHVHNTDTREIHFQIGGHPAFNVPGIEEGAPLSGTMLFDNKGLVERVFGDVEGCIRPGRHAVDSHDGVWQFNEDSFKDDAVIIDKSQLRRISLLNKAMRPEVTVEFTSPAVGIWSPWGKHAPFVCIEPWYGIHDSVEYTGEFKDKYLMNHLHPGASFMSEYKIIIGE